MKELIKQLQQYPKAWGGFETFVSGNWGMLIKMGMLKMQTEWYAPFAFEFYEGVLNSFIESEGYYTSVNKRFGSYQFEIYFDIIEEKELIGISRSDYVYKDKPQAKQAAIVEAFKLIEENHE